MALTASWALSAEAYSSASVLCVARLVAMLMLWRISVSRIWRLPCHELAMDENKAMQITPMMTAMLSWRWNVIWRRKPESLRSMNNC